MALAANEVRMRGFILDRATGALVTTASTVGATSRGGFLRDPDGRIVVARA